MAILSLGSLKSRKNSLIEGVKRQLERILNELNQELEDLLLQINDQQRKLSDLKTELRSGRRVAHSQRILQNVNSELNNLAGTGIKAALGRWGRRLLRKKEENFDQLRILLRQQEDLFREIDVIFNDLERTENNELRQLRGEIPSLTTTRNEVKSAIKDFKGRRFLPKKRPKASDFQQLHEKVKGWYQGVMFRNRETVALLRLEDKERETEARVRIVSQKSHEIEQHIRREHKRDTALMAAIK